MNPGHIILLLAMFVVFIYGLRGGFSQKLGVAGNPNFDAMLSTTIANYRETFSDNLSKSFLLMYWLTTAGRKRHEDGGESILVQLMYGKNTTVKSYSGYGVLDTTPQEGMTASKFPWKQVAGSISISRLEERQNSGESRMINLLQSRVTQAEISMRDSLNAMFFGDGTGNLSQDMFGLQLLVEDGTAWGTLAGIDRSEALNTWWRNQFLGTIGSFDLNGLSKMRNLYNKTSRGNEHPDLILSDQDTYEAYEGVLTVNERFTDQRVGDAGFENLKFKGAVYGFDEQCLPAASMYMLNSNYLELVIDKETDLINTPFIRPENQDARTSQILIMGNLVTSNAARQGLMNGITFP